MVEAPINSIREARNALADNCLSLKEALDMKVFISKSHKTRITNKIDKFEKDVFEIDLWLREFK